MQTQTDGFSFQLSCMFISLQSFFSRSHVYRSLNTIHCALITFQERKRKKKLCCFSLFFSSWASQRSNSFIPFFVCTIIKPQRLGFVDVDVVPFSKYLPGSMDVTYFHNHSVQDSTEVLMRFSFAKTKQKNCKHFISKIWHNSTIYILRIVCWTYETMHIPHKTQFSFENIFQFSAVHQICLFCIQNTLALNARNSIVYYVSFPMEFFNEFQFSKNHNNRHEQFAVHFASLLRANIEHTFWDLINIQQCSWSVVRYGYILFTVWST